MIRWILILIVYFSLPALACDSPVENHSQFHGTDQEVLWESAHDESHESDDARKSGTADHHHGGHCPGHCSTCSGSIWLSDPLLTCVVVPPQESYHSTLPTVQLSGFFLDIFIPPRLIA